MKYISVFLLMIICKISFATIVINGKITKASRPLVISYWSNFSFLSDTIKENNQHLFEKKYDFSTPIHIWINSRSSAFIMPGDTLTIFVNGDNIEFKGNAAQYIQFRNELRNKLSGLSVSDNYNIITKYALDQSEIFFSKYNKGEKKDMKVLNDTDLILSLKFSGLLVANGSNKSKIDSIANFITLKLLDSSYVGNGSLVKYLNKINLNIKSINFHESLNTLNNFVKIIMYNMVLKDKTLEDSDHYLLQKNIITSIFKDSQLSLLLQQFNLYQRIETSKNFAMLNITKEYIDDLNKRSKGTLNMSALEKAYYKKEVQISER